MSAPGQDAAPQVSRLLAKAPLYFTMLREQLFLREEHQLDWRLSDALSRCDSMRDPSLSGLLNADSEEEEEPAAAGPGDKREPPMLWRDLDWKPFSGFYYPIRPGDYSPLSPDGEMLERSGKIGVDFWRWHRERAPLGYTPPLCTCKRTADTVAMLRRCVMRQKDGRERRVCDNDVCRGLLYIPHSLLEIPLNRVISNGSEFVRHVAVPNDTDVYCGNMKHTLVICTTSAEHEAECLEAIRQSDVPDSLVYHVNANGFIPYFKHHVFIGSVAPLMTVEPIDSDVSDSEENRGFGETFAIKFGKHGMVIHKYDSASHAVSPIDDAMLRAWVGKDTDLAEVPPQEPVTALSDYVICELMECFSHDRRPLAFVLRSCKGVVRRLDFYKEEARPDTLPADAYRLDPYGARNKKHKISASDGRKPLWSTALERAHLLKIIDTIELIKS
ncbi:hypothetical protein, conserved [Babesia bigemina]|uniref:Uncharacterized protein n=1 Tax=Babesia bigemina TaxID=5866 RepID=A0A061D852_BABBI|nr:hypothetical protein, conserved [Babesia bigemina]CDR93900.1 hypothetical protein, conserved [Babesia bigemina]|eukprot:XP_012766086.1 hypothetical protein, conserved [Babesia bigemina]